jgi:hypothetical protein
MGGQKVSLEGVCHNQRNYSYCGYIKGICQSFLVTMHVNMPSTYSLLYVCQLKIIEDIWN